MINFDHIKRLVRLAALCCLIICAFATAQLQAQDNFGEFKQKQEDRYAQFLENFENGVAQSEEAYDNYRKAFQEEFNKFKEEMQQKWGDFKERSKKQWVEYKENGNLRVSTDFEEGQGQVEVLADSKEEAEQIREEMPEKVNDALQSKGTREGFETESLPRKEITAEPVLSGQLNKPESMSIKQYATEIAEKKTKTKEVTGDDGETRYVVYVDFSLASDHLQQRAQKVEDEVYEFAQKHNLDPALIFAIAHVESYFNPTAASHANAYGLMQVVPKTAGRDAYRRIYNEDGIPTKEYLFKPRNNIQMGCTFIDILTNTYFDGVEDQTTLLYLMISAYNTGAGNVAVAYTGDTSLSEAFPKINSMSPEENFRYLRENLEYAEARNYLKKVNDRRLQYMKWQREGEG